MFSLNCLLMNSQTLVFSIFVYVQQRENLAYEGNCVQFLILVCSTSSPGNAHTCQMSYQVPNVKKI
jgi:hypothetical protein